MRTLEHLTEVLFARIAAAGTDLIEPHGNTDSQRSAG